MDFLACDQEKGTPWLSLKCTSIGDGPRDAAGGGVGAHSDCWRARADSVDSFQWFQTSVILQRQEERGKKKIPHKGQEFCNSQISILNTHSDALIR